MIAPDTKAQGQHEPDMPPHKALPPPGHNEPPLAATLREWVETNQNVAILGAFAVGVFFGVLMRR